MLFLAVAGAAGLTASAAFVAYSDPGFTVSLFSQILLAMCFWWHSRSRNQFAFLAYCSTLITNSLCFSALRLLIIEIGYVKDVFEPLTALSPINLSSSRAC